VRLYLQKTPEKEELGWLKWKQLPIKCKVLSSNPSTAKKKKKKKKKEKLGQSKKATDKILITKMYFLIFHLEQIIYSTNVC
jgi:hypothetical protein